MAGRCSNCLPVPAEPRAASRRRGWPSSLCGAAVAGQHLQDVWCSPKLHTGTSCSSLYAKPCWPSTSPARAACGSHTEHPMHSATASLLPPCRFRAAIMLLSAPKNMPAETKDWVWAAQGTPHFHGSCTHRPFGAFENTVQEGLLATSCRP